MQRLLLAAWLGLHALLERTRRDPDRGDVPGWVMITVMTALVVIVLLGVFRDAVTDAVKEAFDKVRHAK